MDIIAVYFSFNAHEQNLTLIKFRELLLPLNQRNSLYYIFVLCSNELTISPTFLRYKNKLFNYNKLSQIITVESVPHFLPHRHSSAESRVGLVSWDGAAPYVAKGRVAGVNTQAVWRRLVPHAECPLCAELTKSKEHVKIITPRIYDNN